MAWPVYLYAPNVIGYIRIVICFVAFKVAFTHPAWFSGLYFASFVGDYLDGRFAVWFNQKSTFGALLDMVTDRLSTACLLVLLSHLFQQDLLFFLFLIALDISSHWFQMYSSFLGGKSSHKDLSAQDFLLMRLYYGNRMFMAYCCVGAELFYLALFHLRDPSLGVTAGVKDHVAARLTATDKWTSDILVIGTLGLLSVPGWAVKQIVNFVQLKQSADICVQHDVLKNK